MESVAAMRRRSRSGSSAKVRWNDLPALAMRVSRIYTIYNTQHSTVSLPLLPPSHSQQRGWVVTNRQRPQLPMHIPILPTPTTHISSPLQPQYPPESYIYILLQFLPDRPARLARPRILQPYTLDQIRDPRDLILLKILTRQSIHLDRNRRVWFFL